MLNKIWKKICCRQLSSRRLTFFKCVWRSRGHFSFMKNGRKALVVIPAASI